MQNLFDLLLIINKKKSCSWTDGSTDDFDQMTPSGRTQNPSSVRTDGFCTGRVDSETRSVGAGTVTSTFSGILCRLNGGPFIIFGGQRGRPNDDVDPRWYERLNYCDGRLEARHFEHGKLIAKKRRIRINKLAALTQPAVVQESA